MRKSEKKKTFGFFSLFKEEHSEEEKKSLKKVKVFGIVKLQKEFQSHMDI